MEHINHFKQELVTFELDGTFQYKPLIAEDELEMDLSFCYVENNGETTFDLRRFNTLRLAHNLKTVPYSPETINSIIGKQAEWNSLNVQDKIKILLKLSSSVFQKILEQADAVDYPNLEIKKNSKN